MGYYSRPRISKISNEREQYGFFELINDLLIYDAPSVISGCYIKRVKLHKMYNNRNRFRYFCRDNEWIPDISTYAYHKQRGITKISDIRRKEIM